MSVQLYLSVTCIAVIVITVFAFLEIHKTSKKINKMKRRMYMTENRLYEIINSLVDCIKERNDNSLNWIWTDTSITKEEIEYCREILERNKELQIPIQLGVEYKIESYFYEKDKNTTVIPLAPVNGEPDLYQCAIAERYKNNPDDFWLSNGEVNFSGNNVLLLYDFELRRI